jgi:hypothetical protein
MKVSFAGLEDGRSVGGFVVLVFGFGFVSVLFCLVFGGLG